MDPRPGMQQPLSIPWRDWLRSSDWNGKDYTGEPIDAIIIGSGYGGSVAALRLVEKGYRTLLLERGSEFLAGEFPNDFSQLPKSLRVNIPLREQPVGRAAGLVEVHVGQGFVALGGNGLGGGSLINAGVAMRPDTDVFQQPQWPAAIRNEAESMQPWLDKAHEALGAERWPDLPDGRRLRKTEALERLAAPLGGRVEAVDVTIDPQRCIRCGDCASGCNVPGAKKTLAATYLAQAMKSGLLTIVTQAEVYDFQPSHGWAGFHWEVHAFATEAQQHFVATREVVQDKSPSATHRTVHAPKLFVCAGTIGSTQLLQRSQARSGNKLQFSSMLGQRLSGNGDSLGWAVDEPSLVSSHGRGTARPAEEMAKARQGRPYDVDLLVGPTITAALRVRGGDTAPSRINPPPLHERLVVEDGAIPRAIAQLARELLATAHTLRQLDDWSFRKPVYRGAELEDPLAASAVRAQHGQVLLTMGHDGSPGRLVWLEDTDRTAPYLLDAKDLDGYDAQKKAFGRLGTRYVQNPVWEPLPRSATELMSGADVPASVTTVHPLGGCVMGDSVETGVVDDCGRVRVRDPGCPALLAPSVVTASVMPEIHGKDEAEAARAKEREQHRLRARPHYYNGLYVLDGSIVPTALGCNPLLTITALAERALADLGKNVKPRHAVDAQRSAERPVTPPAVTDVAIAASLRETLLARGLQLPPGLAQTFGHVRLAARFEAAFPSDDLLRSMTRAQHGFPVEGRLLLGPELADPEKPPVTYTIHPERSSFHFLPAGHASSGWWPAISTFFQAVPVAIYVGALALAYLVRVRPGPRTMAFVGFYLLPLPLMRSLLTWWVLRGERDLAEGGMSNVKGQFWHWVASMLRQMTHASEKRVMRYRVHLLLDDPATHPQWPRELTMHAHKRVTYRASLRQVLAWMCKREHTAIDGSPETVPIRPTFWEQAMDAQVRLVAGGRTMARAVFRMGMENLLAAGTRKGTVPPALTLGPAGDTTTGLLAAASYPLLFLRFGLKTRLFDFRLPAYSNLPVSETLDAQQNALRQGVVPDVLWVKAKRGNSSSDTGLESTADVELPLLRYKRPEGIPEVVAGKWNGRPVARAKSILLLHAFGQSSFTFTFQGESRNLAETLYDAGYEVWVLDSRMSTRARANREPSTVDQLALHDIPAAVEKILHCLASDLPEEKKTGPLQIAAFAHCIGSAALWMSVLAGKLTHGDKSPGQCSPQLPKLSHVVFSQLHPWVVGGRVPQSKTWLPAMLSKLGLDTIPFAVRGRQDGLVAQLVDRFFASMPSPAAERASLEGHDDAVATMRRIRYIDAQLYRQDHLDDRTRSAMNRLFGDANLRLFGHARRFIDHERLVNENGVNQYVTPYNMECHLGLPIQLLHGEDNELFDVAGAQLTFEKVGELYRDLQQTFSRSLDGKGIGFLRIPRYGHLDVLIGRHAHQHVFPAVVDFLQRVHATPDIVAVPKPADGYVVRPPLLGPFIGWTRRDAKGKLVVRISFAVDEGRRTWDCKAQNIYLRCKRGAVYETANDVRVRPVDVNDPYRFVVIDATFDQDPRTEDWQLLLVGRTRGADRVAGVEALDLTGPEPPRLPDSAIATFLATVTHEPDEPVIPPLFTTAWDYDRSFFTLPQTCWNTLGHDNAVTLAVASCRYPGLGLDADRADRPLQDFLADPRVEEAAFAMLLGDQIYADATAGLVDPLSPLERYFERHKDAFARGALGALAARMPVYMAADDHEWGDNYPSAAPLTKRPWPRWREASGDDRFGDTDESAFEAAARAVRDFQRLQAPWDFGTAPQVLGGDSRRDATPFLGDYHFEHGCASFYVLDSRSRRSRNDSRIVPDLDALQRWLLDPAQSRGLVVIASGSVVLPGLRPNADPADVGPPDTWQYAPDQRAALLDLLVQHARGRFVLLSGDYHVSGMVDLLRGDEHVGCAVVSPPLYAPLVYANSAPDTVYVEEQVTLPSGELRMRVRPGGEFARGSGVGLLTLEPGHAPALLAAVRYHRKLWVWEEGRSVEHDTDGPATEVHALVAATRPAAPLAPATP
ncbi:GMC family oxidoreductase N-terminal domain-containing protein [Ramlibacter algicola]|uniref:GMC family oxidoreductase N-terminal domain-containing protein n=1 Tax=Ramlibacter algicola TaxID=2795217 RepID=A0A934Q042_9BURK|nr:GMC family oxidoreductase N-terminal domain-containing protein [Ramlibacter algicola]MBK0392031.1 GMC family oxidoreductase N-terminal domain-containing protein [Ramlibacter algicola]